MSPSRTPNGHRAASAERREQLRAHLLRVGAKTRIKPGEKRHWKHGLRSRDGIPPLQPSTAELVLMREQREAAMIADLGGRDELSSMELDLVADCQRLGSIQDWNARRMLHPRASVRREATAVFMAATDRRLTILKMLGIKRRQRSVPLDAHAWLDQQHHAEHHAASADTSDDLPAEDREA